MVTVAVSTLGCSDIHFLEPGVKINGEYYRNTVLRKMLLPDIRRVSRDLYTFQQDSAPAHRPRATVEMLKTETPDFIPSDLWPPNSPDLNPVAYTIWSILQEKVYQHRINDLDELKQRLCESGPNWITQSSQLRFVSGVVVCQLVCRLTVDILNIIFSHALSICRLVD